MLPRSRTAAPSAAFALALCATLSAFGRGVTDTYAVFLVPLSAEFGWDRGAAASVYGVALLTVGLSAPLIGRMFDAWGPGRLNALGIGLLGLAMLGAATLEALWQFYLLIGVVGGIGACAVSVFAQAALLNRWFYGRLTTALATVAAASGFGVLVLSPAVQLLIERFGWRGAYLCLGSLALLILVALSLVPWQAMARGRSDPTAGDSPGPALAAPSAIGLREAMRTRAFWALCGAHFLTANGMFAINPQIVALLVDVGFPAITAASAFGFAGAATTVGLLVFGWLADRRGKLLSVTASYVMTLGGFLILLALAAAPSMWLLVAFVLVYGPSFGSRGPIISAITAQIFGRGPNFGVILGAVSLGLGTGGAIGATVGGLLHDWTASYQVVAGYAFATVAAGMLLFWVVPELRRQ